VRQTYRFELDPNEAQRVLLAKSVGASRFVYNWGLEQFAARLPPTREAAEAQ
jgi:transposase